MPNLNANETPSGEKVRGREVGLFTGLTKRVFAMAMLMLATAPMFAVSAVEAVAQDKSLKLYFVHTGERANITFKRNGKFDPRGLAQINNLLRDWRKNEPARMDPRLFDLVWEVYRRSGASDYVHVVSAYRSPATNNMLRGRSRNTGVAKNSQHTLGKAMDFYIPGVKLSTLRALAMQMQVGGVGFYPRSGSPFVHLDVGGVRAWPRMTRDELVQIFPKGNTMHLPADGKPLPGYDQAVADYKRRVGSEGIQIASTAGAGVRGDSETKRQPNLLAFLFGGGGADEEEDNEEIAAPVRRPAPPARPAPAPADEEAPAPVVVAAAAPQITAPVPLARPAFRNDPVQGGLATALYSPARNAAQEALALQASAPAGAQQPAGQTFTDLSTYNIPVPTLLGSRGFKGDAETNVMTASVGPLPQEMASVPLPAQRPLPVAVAAQPMPVALPKPDAKADEQQELTPALIAALAQSVDYRRSTPAPALPAPVVTAAVPAPVAPQPVPAQRPVETAAVSPKVIQPSAKTMQFGDQFDMPKPAVAASAGALPAPSSRPGQGVGSSALTGEMLAKWALNSNRSGQASNIKAPRVVNRTLAGEAPVTSGGFKPVAPTTTASIDMGRFSGPNN